MAKLYGSLEAGGTKFVFAVGDEKFKSLKNSIPNNYTLQKQLIVTIEFFKRYEDGLEGIAISSFGPIDVDPNSETYGFVTSTQKPHWSNIDLLGLIAKEFNVPFYFTTDVNSSAYGETLARKGVKSLVYYTIGTGIGAGAIQNGEFIGGLGHTEVGHVYVPLHPNDVANEFNGTCPFHRGCLEGLAAGPSLEARTGIRGELIEQNSEGLGCSILLHCSSCCPSNCALPPRGVIVFGGGVMGQEHMLRRVRENSQLC